MNYLLAIILPPVGVLAAGGSGVQVILNIILTFAMYLPGMIHALYVVHSRR